MGIYTTVERIPIIMDHLTHECQKIGLSINLRKITVYTKFSAPFDASGLQISHEGLEILGCPFGSHMFVTWSLDHLFEDWIT